MGSDTFGFGKGKIMATQVKVLFVCGRNKRRSPTAEKIFKTDRRVVARSAGISDTSRVKLTEGDIKWADLILVMERKHEVRLKVKFNYLDTLPPIEMLDIHDDYIYMHPELVSRLREELDAALEKYWEELAEKESD